MERTRVFATTRVRVLVEVDQSDTWPPAATIEQIMNDASRSAVNCVKRRMGPTTAGETGVSFRLIGEPVPELVLVKEKA